MPMPTSIGMSDRMITIVSVVAVAIFVILVAWGVGIWSGVLPSSF